MLELQIVFVHNLSMTVLEDGERPLQYLYSTRVLNNEDMQYGDSDYNVLANLHTL